MAASKTERQVFMWKVHPRAVPANSEMDVTLAEILNLLKQEFEAKRARVYLTSQNRIIDEDAEGALIDSKHQIYVADIKRNERYNCVTLLINRGDPDAVSPAFIDPENNDVRVEHPKEKEAPGWSAHLTISLAEDHHGAHRACFEKMPRVSSSLVMNAIDKIISKAAIDKGTYTWIRAFRDGNAIKHETRDYRPVLGVHKIPSEKLNSDLQSGSLAGVTLTKRKVFYDGVGVGHIVKRQEEKVVIKTQPAERSVISRFISGLTAKAREEGYETYSFISGICQAALHRTPA